MAKQDLALDTNGDLLVNSSGDFVPIDSVRQGVQIKLRWVKGEWVFNPSFGVPYFETILVKAPNVALIEKALRDQILSVEGIVSVGSVDIDIDAKGRVMKAKFTASTTNEEIESEVDLSRGLRNYG